MAITPTKPKAPREYVVKSISVHRRDLPALMRAAKKDRRSFSSYLVACALAEVKSRELDAVA